MTSTDVVEIRSDGDFTETLRRLDQALAAREVTVFARIDHAANARAAGLSMPPAVVVVFGSGRAGTPLMRQAPSIALDLPLRILVREDEAGIVVSHHDPVAVVTSFGLPAEAAQALLAVGAIAAEAAGAL